MPLDEKCSVDAFDANVSALVKEGKDQKQAVAIAYDVLRKACGVQGKESFSMTPKEIVAAKAESEVAAAASRMLSEASEREIEGTFFLSDGDSVARLDGTVSVDVATDPSLPEAERALKDALAGAEAEVEAALGAGVKLWPRGVRVREGTVVAGFRITVMDFPGFDGAVDAIKSALEKALGGER